MGGFFRSNMGDARAKRWKCRVLPTKGPKAGAMRKTPLSRQQLAGRQRHESPVLWFFYSLGEEYVVLLD